MTQKSELAELNKKAQDSGSRTDLDNYLKARRKFKCPECGWFNGLHNYSCKIETLRAEKEYLEDTLDDKVAEACKELDSQIEGFKAEIVDLKQDLLEFGRHSEGCNYPYGEAYGCKCGWLETMKRLA